MLTPRAHVRNPQVISTAYDLTSQHAAYRANPAGAAGVNTSHVVHRLNYLNPRSSMPEKVPSAWGSGWWTKRLVGFGALKEPDTQVRHGPTAAIPPMENLYCSCK